MPFNWATKLLPNLLRLVIGKVKKKLSNLSQLAHVCVGLFTWNALSLQAMAMEVLEKKLIDGPSK